MSVWRSSGPRGFPRLAGLLLTLGAGTAFAQAGTGAAESVQTVTIWWWVAPAASVLALIFAFAFYKRMMRADEGSDKMKEIAGYVREGAMAYLFRQYKVVAVVFLVLFVIFSVLAIFGMQNVFVPVAFLTGGFFSALCGYIGMRTATNASARTAQGGSVSLNRGLQVAFRSGAVMGLVVVGLGLLYICLWYLILNKWVYTAANMSEGWTLLGMTVVPKGCSELEKLLHIATTMVTFGMGASTQALFARVGGGIYTKAADVGADLVGKVEAGIPEDDPRNPATIADNVGDLVGDVAGMGADLYESYCASILAAAALGAAVGMQKRDLGLAVNLVTAPMIVAGIGTLLSILACLLVRCGDKADMKALMKSLSYPLWGSTIAIAAVCFFLATPGVGLITYGVAGSVCAGLFAGCVIGKLTEYFTSDAYAPTRGIAEQANMGPATVIIDGLATGMYSTGLPVAVIVVGILSAFGLAGGFSDFSMGLYGIGFAAVGMLSTLGFSLATDAYGPIADNAGGNAEMAGLGEEVRRRTDALDMLGNTTAAIGKGFAIGSAALTAMALLAAYIEEVKIWIAKLAGDGTFSVFGRTFTAEQAHNAGIRDIIAAYDMSVMNPFLLCGLFLGAMMAFVFCAMTMKAVGRAAGAMVNEVRRQFREIPGIMTGQTKPDYSLCVDISTAGAQKEMIIPSLMAITVPVATGLVLGIAGVMGLLAGGLACGFVLATMLNNAGGAWDNAKKYIEKGAHGGKGSAPHKAAVVGDTVGDPCKDTSGPSLNILIKLMTMVSIVFAPVVVKFSPQIMAWVFQVEK